MGKKSGQDRKFLTRMNSKNLSKKILIVLVKLNSDKENEWVGASNAKFKNCTWGAMNVTFMIMMVTFRRCYLLPRAGIGSAFT